VSHAARFYAAIAADVRLGLGVIQEAVYWLDSRSAA
jgi:hypothetical protein